MFGRRRSRSRESEPSQGTDEILVAADIEREGEVNNGETSMGDMLGPDQVQQDEAYMLTRNHPMGRILLKNLTDLTNLAKKTNTKESEANINDFCLDFCAALDLEKEQLDQKIKENNSIFEQTLIDKELDSHKINATFTPPTEWGRHPTLISAGRITAANKAFPSMGKFRGFPKDGYLNIIEFLTVLRNAQEQCKLSMKEFIDKMILSSTGEAHEIISYCQEQGESVPDIYHNLIMRFDDRLPIEEAKSRLQSFKGTKSMNLAKVESQIMIYANRASSQYPIGVSRTAFYNLEACQALIKSLPIHAQNIATTAYNSLTAKLQMAPTYSIFTRALNSHRAIIDKDLKQNGTEPVRFGQFTGRKSRAQSRNYTVNNKRSDYTTYSVSSTGAEAVSQTPKPNFKNSGYGNRSQSTGANFTPVNQNGRGYQGNRGRVPQGSQPYRNFNSRGGTSGRPTNKFNNSTRGRFNNRPSSNLYCSLCGYRNHKAPDCRNIRDDTGAIRQIIPTMGTCSKCPGYITSRLHHPEVYCPFRAPKGVLYKPSN
jgi:hypothetical protein